MLVLGGSGNGAEGKKSSMITPWDLKIFGIAPGGKQRPGGPSGDLVVLGSPPRVFTLGTLIAVDIFSVVWALLIIFTNQHIRVTTIMSEEVLFLVSLILLTLARMSVRFPAVLGYYVVTFALSVLLNVLFQSGWGDFGLLAVCGFALFRFPFRWAWPIAAVSIVVLAGTHGLGSLLLTHQISDRSQLVTIMGVAAFICWNGWSNRARYLLVFQLQEVQAQLRAQMQRAEELAATRERTRIARDIHDVLAHTLTVLSVQVQAARQLVHQNPDRLAAKLDDIATLLRESLAESRRVVGLLRETTISSTSHSDVSTQLYAIVEHFGERTGIRCLFEEEGEAQVLSDEQSETLQFALQEALTNAHRHGSAQHVWVKLRWQDQEVTLQVCDDGRGLDSDQKHEGTHHGLQGMRERATASGGSLESGPQTEGGFAITLRLPLDSTRRALPRGGAA